MWPDFQPCDIFKQTVLCLAALLSIKSVPDSSQSGLCTPPPPLRPPCDVIFNLHQPLMKGWPWKSCFIPNERRGDLGFWTATNKTFNSLMSITSFTNSSGALVSLRPWEPFLIFAIALIEEWSRMSSPMHGHNCSFSTYLAHFNYNFNCIILHVVM